jgi:membrane associated rhomboid family serine protease
MTAEVLRYVAALLAAGSLAVWVHNSLSLWPFHDWHERRVSMSLGLLLMFMAYGFGAAAHRADPLHAGTVLLTVALATLFGSLLWGRKRSMEAHLSALRGGVVPSTAHREVDSDGDERSG